MVAEGGLRRRGEDGLGKLRGLGETLGKLDAADRAVLVIGLLARASEVTTHDALDGHRSGLLHEHGATEEVILVLGELSRVVGRVKRDDVVGQDVLELLEPEGRDTREDLALVRNLIRKDEVVRADAVARDHQQRVTAVVDVTDLTLRVWALPHCCHTAPLPLG